MLEFCILFDPATRDLSCVQSYGCKGTHSNTVYNNKRLDIGYISNNRGAFANTMANQQNVK